MTSLLRAGNELLALRGLQPALQSRFLISCRSSSSTSDAHKDQEDEVIERKPEDYRPGSDSYAYENPWPKLNRGRLDWLFGDGWRRPLAKDQGAKLRREWIWFEQCAYDEHADWKKFHQIFFFNCTLLVIYFTLYIVYARPDWPWGREWALREAHLEIERRQKAGLPLISKDLIDPKRVAQQLPAEEELRDFDIII